MKAHMPNRLASETSPYLIQHAENPVDWYPWGPEAFERARREDKPILLSIGYAACHWCHVMAHESFEDEATAKVMNELFVNIKVDREERPDIDSIYMQAVQALTGHGGWPMTMFLSPDGSPFYGGTYYPPQDRHGMPSFTKVLNGVADAYRNRREGIEKTAADLKRIYASAEERASSAGALDGHLLDLAYRGIARGYDGRHGGFGGAPKFPQTMSLDFLLRYWRRHGTDYALEMARDSFVKMARGGIYDQVGGGFARYSVDAHWLVPHFEKMLYDNALLARLGAHLWQATKDDEIRRVTVETVGWVAREMTSPEGGFYSSLDADSEGHEGKFYVWSEAELDSLLGADSAAVKTCYGVSASGNFEGANILFVQSPPAVTAARLGITIAELDALLERAKKTLYAVRARRVWPGLDDKILAGWNGLMTRGIAAAARAFDRADFRELALRNAEFLHREMIRDGRVMRSHKAGVTRILGVLEDQAAVGLAFIAAYELDFDGKWIARAVEVTSRMVELFWDDTAGAFFDTAHDAEKLITRPRDFTDNAVPSGTSLAAELLLHMSELLGDEEMRRRGTFVLETLGGAMTRYPTAVGHALGVADISVNGAVEVALAGDPTAAAFQALERVVAETYVPSLVLAGGRSDGHVHLLSGREPGDSAARAFVCRRYACDSPVSTPADLGRQLDAAPVVSRTVAQ